MTKARYITPHFHTDEFACADGTPYPEAWIEARLRPLCEALETLRKHLGEKAIVISSGYRTPAYNTRIGGAKRSKHTEGIAADIVVPGLSASYVHERIVGLVAIGILPQGGIGAYPSFTHYDLRGTPARWRGNRLGN